MTILETTGWNEYTLLDSGDGMRLEKFGPYTLIRPDPQCLWQTHLAISTWEKADAIFAENNTKGRWEHKRFIPDKWKMHYKDLTFYAKLTPFKHTGVFPEQHVHWDWLEEKIKKENKKNTSSSTEPKASGEVSSRFAKAHSNKTVNVLNLFAYTGIASLICANAGAEVTHVDASFPTIGWAKENQALSNLSDTSIRWILDDCLKFVQREIKRGVRYDGIIMDPPVFGHGPKGERWEFNESFPVLLDACRQIVTDQPLFILINAYAVSASSIMLQNMLEDMMGKYKGKVEAGELALEEKTRKRLLSTGIFARWSNK